jgi:hypothetical protein
MSVTSCKKSPKRSEAQKRADKKYSETHKRPKIVQVVVTNEEYEKLQEERGSLSMSAFARSRIFE